MFVADVHQPRLEPHDHHHVARVLRVRPGETVTVCDGRGSWRTCVLTSAGDLEASDDEIVVEQQSRPPITIAFGLTKSDKPEFVVQKLTELGVDHIVPVVLEHSIVKWDVSKSARQHERFMAISREAAMQSRQVFLPMVHPVASDLDALMNGSVMANQWGVVAVADPNGDVSVDQVSAVVIGPEGGVSPAEMNRFDHAVRLPGGILRAETAAVAAAVVLLHEASRDRL